MVKKFKKEWDELRLFFTGDTHIPYDIHKLNSKNFPLGKELTKQDVVVICGDFGGVWQDDKEERFWLSWLEGKPWTTVFVDGNHECFPRLYDLEEQFWNGGKVGVVRPSIFHLKRGECYAFPNHISLFALGGAVSRDKHLRTEGVNWWKEELPSEQELNYARTQLDEANWKADLIVTHDAPLPILRTLNLEADRTLFATFLNELVVRGEFRYWFNGHLHQDVIVAEKYVSLYQEIIEVVKTDDTFKLIPCNNL